MMVSNTEKTIAAYDRNADRFAGQFRSYAPYRKQLIRFQEDHLDSGASILDVGCGPGLNACLLMDQGSAYRIRGFDLSIEMVRLAKATVPQAHFWVQDMRRMAVTGAFDAIIAAFCIVHLSDDDVHGFLETIPTLLVENGSLFLSFMTGRTPGWETTGFSKDPIFFNYFKADDIRRRLTISGLAIADTIHEPYAEADGSTIDDVFFFARKA